MATTYSFPLPAREYYVYCGRVRLGTLQAPGNLSQDVLLEQWLDTNRISRPQRPYYHLNSQ